MIGATVAIVAMAALFVVYGALHLAGDGRCGSCEEEADSCGSCPFRGDEIEQEGRIP